MSYLETKQLILVKEEFEAVRVSVSYLEGSWPRLQVEQMPGTLKLVQVKRAALNLEATYIVRLFSVFESVLRQLLPLRMAGSTDRRNVYDLINRAASKWRISAAVRDESHRIREFRNGSVHQNASGTSRLLFTEALAGLNQFLGWLP